MQSWRYLGEANELLNDVNWTCRCGEVGSEVCSYRVERMSEAP
jgi:hypothetical protein